MSNVNLGSRGAPKSLEETFCFEASLCVNGKKIGRVSNRGHGGCHAYGFSWKEEEKLDEWCRTNLPKWKMSDDPLIPDADKKHPEITKERDTSLETHINSLVCNFLEKKDLFCRYFCSCGIGDGPA